MERSKGVGAMADITDSTRTEDALALDLLKSSGVLNPNLTLDKLMDVSRQLAELESVTSSINGSGVTDRAVATFAGKFYVYTYVWR
jgi:hypothetical protein